MQDRILEVVRQATGLSQPHLEVPEQEAYGDYATNAAMLLAKKDGRPAKEVAEELVNKLKNDSSLSEIVEKVEVAGPGFINFFLSKKALLSELEKALKENYGSSQIGKGKTVLVEYSSPNIAKTFGVGHLRSTIIGQALYNLFKSLGYTTISENHIGDWGTQFGTLLYQINSKHLTPGKLTVGELEGLYVDFNQKAEADPKLWEEARAWFKKLEEGDSGAKEIWEEVRKISLSEFERIYQRLGVSFENMHGESFYKDKMPAVLEEVRAKSLAKKSEGAQIIEFKNMPPAMLVKSDGTTTYFTRDLATAKFRVETLKPELLIYEVGSDQILHFRQVFETVRLMGWAQKQEFVHVAHGLIRFSGGKMSTRRGQTVKLEEVLDEAVSRARKIIDGSVTGRGFSDSQKEEVSKAVGIGAIKYFDLMHHPSTDIIFNWDKIFVLEGNSGPYLQYTYARTNSVLGKSGKSQTDMGSPKIDKPNPEELAVLRFLARFPQTVQMAAASYSPNLLANYLFELAQKYNNFYNQHKIIGGDNQEFRLILTSATGKVLESGLSILGIQTPQRM
jgi:arginyl-tRNA synthetase